MAMSEDTGAMWAVLLMLPALPAVGYALVTRLTGRGRKGRPPWRPGDDPVCWTCAGAALAGHALAATTVVGDWGGMSGVLWTMFAAGCCAGAVVHAYDAFARPARSGSGPAPRRPRPALLLVAPYAFALGFFWLVAG